MRVTRLRCDYMIDPVGFDFSRPTLGWVMEDDDARFNRRQSAYRLQVAHDEAFDYLLYDSQKTLSNQNVGLRLEAPLAGMTRYFWRVMIWDEANTPSTWSRTAFFETARCDAPWTAQWIAPDLGNNDIHPMLRKGFALAGEVRSARIYACGVGLYELFLNGRRVGDERMTPGYTAYDKWLPYQTYDVTDMVRSGDNALGAYLGRGWYRGRLGWNGVRSLYDVYGDAFALLCELVIEYRDGTREIIGTDGSWKAAESPLLLTDIYDGETYDARREVPGWNLPGYDDAAWHGVKPCGIGTDRVLARKSPPVRIMQERKPQAIFYAPNGDLLVDFGQNMTGWVQLKVRAPRGTELTFTHAEALDKDGNFYNANMRTAQVTQRYITRGEGEETYAPHFTFFGFRYIKITGWPGMPTYDQLTAQVVHTDMEQTGRFSCSHADVNRLFENTVWGQRSNFLDVPTDCPQRDERMGWTGDAQVFAATASMHMQTDAFYRKYLYDLACEQADVGYVPVVVPNVLRFSSDWGAPTAGWGDAATIIPWVLYVQYGDVAALEQQYPSMKAWVEYITSCDTEKRDLYYGPNHIGDWLAQDTGNPDKCIGATPTDFIASAYYAYSATLVSKAAAVLGKHDDAQGYAALAERIKKALEREYITPSGRIVSETQTAQAVALFMDLPEPRFRGRAADMLHEKVRSNDYLLTTGFIGTPYLCLALSQNGYNDTAYRLLLSNAFPSWLYTVGKGATTMWERWNSIKPDGSMGAVEMNSFNHYAYGAIAEWMYRVVAGINADESQPGYRHAILRPQPNAQLAHAEAELMTVSGRYASSWRLEGTRLCLTITIPCNAGATIVLPSAQNAAITENGAPLADALPFERGSGTYVYEYDMAQDPA